MQWLGTKRLVGDGYLAMYANRQVAVACVYAPVAVVHKRTFATRRAMRAWVNTIRRVDEFKP